MTALPSYYALAGYTIPTDGQYRTASRTAVTLTASSSPSTSVAAATGSSTIAPAPIVSSSTSLSSGAKAGIGIGVAAVALSITVLLWYIYILRRRFLARVQPMHESTKAIKKDNVFVKPEMPAASRTELCADFEQQALRKYELPGDLNARKELGTTSPAQLP
ncbi:MAG: hypothetical protein Q9166_000379 [cf. Caloplaca sp. 2 TL-2023]